MSELLNSGGGHSNGLRPLGKPEKVTLEEVQTLNIPSKEQFMKSIGEHPQGQVLMSDANGEASWNKLEDKQRRIFNIDVGNVPQDKVQQYVDRVKGNLKSMPIVDSKPEHLKTDVEKLSIHDEELFEAKLMEDFVYYSDNYPSISMTDSSEGCITQKLRVQLSNDGDYKMADIFFEMMHLIGLKRKNGFLNPRAVVNKLSLTPVMYDPVNFCPRRGLMISWELKHDGKEEFLEEETPELNIKFESVKVECKPRKLRAKWTPELAEKVHFYGENSEPEEKLDFSEVIKGISKLERIQLEVELDQIKNDKYDFVELQKWEEAHEAREKQYDIERKLGLRESKSIKDEWMNDDIKYCQEQLFAALKVPKEYFDSKDDIYIKRDDMTDEQYSAFDEDGEPIQDIEIKMNKEYTPKVGLDPKYSVQPSDEKKPNRNPLDRY